MKDRSIVLLVLCVLCKQRVLGCILYPATVRFVRMDVGDIMKTTQGILCICQMQNCLTDGFEDMSKEIWAYRVGLLSNSVAC